MMGAQLQLAPGAPQPAPDSGRVALDAYYTPDRLARAGLAVLQRRALDPKVGIGVGLEGVVWEGHVGGGAWARAVLDHPNADRIELWVSDLDREADGLHRRGYRPDRYPPQHRRIAGHDFTARSLARAWQRPPPQLPPQPDWIIGNPPFKGVEAQLRAALRYTRRHVLYLMPLALVESKGRRPFWAEYTARHVWPLDARVPFTGQGCANQPLGLFWFDLDFEGETTLTPCWSWGEEPPLRAAA